MIERFVETHHYASSQMANYPGQRRIIMRLYVNAIQI